jgi:hypothetical protein
MLYICLLHKNYNFFVFKFGAITMDHVQGFDRSQEILFPAKIDDYIEEENLVRFIEAQVY